jgi:uncharacterized membrane protein
MGALARVLLALLASSALSVATLAVEIHESGDSFYRFLVWNLFLAWVPVAAALAATVAAQKRATVAVVIASGLWIVFFPNAPYMLTDYIHLGEGFSAAPLWYDALMLSAFAWTAMLLGFFSLYLMQRLWTPYVGPIGSWVLVVLALALASFGVYLGRFVRINSWDALLRPRRIAHVVAHQFDNPLHHPALVGVIVVVTAFLLTGYWIICSFARLAAEMGAAAANTPEQQHPLSVVGDNRDRAAIRR